MVPKFNSNKRYETIIPEQKQLIDSFPVKATLDWYADGSKTKHGAEAGILGLKPSVKPRNEK